MDPNEYEKVEKAKLLKAIRDSGVVGENYEAIKHLLLSSSDDETAIEKTIKGLSEEDEFALICHLMGTATHLVPLEQRPFITGDYIVPDFMARFQPGCSIAGYGSQDSDGYKCFIEVKSTNKTKRKIGGSRLRRLRNFADEFELPLLIAMRFLEFNRNAVWVVIEDNNRSKTSITISIENLVNQIRYVLWDEYWYMIPPNALFKCIADKSSQEEGVVTPYGIQQKFEILLDGKVISFNRPESTIVSAFFEAFNLQEKEIIKIDENITAQILEPNLYVCSMVDMVYNFSVLPIDENGHSTHNASRTIRSLEDTLFDINFVERIAESLRQKGVLYNIGFADKEEHLENWKEYGGAKKSM